MEAGSCLLTLLEERCRRIYSRCPQSVCEQAEELREPECRRQPFRCLRWPYRQCNFSGIWTVYPPCGARLRGRENEAVLKMAQPGTFRHSDRYR